MPNQNDTTFPKHRRTTVADLPRLKRTRKRLSKPYAPGEGKPGRGIANKTMEFVDRMDELGCAPEEFLARVIIGQEPPAANPFLDLLELWLERNRDKPLTEARIAQLMERARKYLSYEPASIDIRVNAARDLMQYKYPKRKAVEHTGNITVGTGVLRLAEPINEDKWVEMAESEAIRILEHEADA
jgi:hypothetical protein